ncbi:MAG: HAD-IC family P-type ATPase [Legionella sp.]|nr:HAD-IC family P-type ATPase [Legionella sp.]
MAKSYVFYVHGMTCVSCSGMIQSILENTDLSILGLSPLKQFNVDISAEDPKELIITLQNDKEISDSGWQKLRGLIEELGFRCENSDYLPNNRDVAKPDIKDEFAHINYQQHPLTKWLKSHWFLGSVGTISGITLLAIGLIFPVIPLGIMIGFAAFSTVLTLALGANSYKDAWKKLVKANGLTMDSLFTISTLSVLVVSVLSFFIPWLPMMFETGLLIYGFRHIGLAIEERLKKNIRSTRFEDRLPEKIIRVGEEKQEEVLLSLINPSDTLIINEGAVIPVDGMSKNDHLIYDTIITGSITPKLYPAGSNVLAGMKVAQGSGQFHLTVKNSMDNSYLKSLDKQISESIKNKAPIEIKTAQILTYFIPLVIALALVSGFMISLFFPVALAIQTAVSVLVSACPCTLGLIIPLAVKTGMFKAAKQGVLFKDSAKLQYANQIDTVVFDLNGTLTQGIPTVKDYQVLSKSGISQSYFLKISAALEQQTLHPVGKAIWKSAPELEKTPEVTHAKQHSLGAEGLIDGKRYLIGGTALMKENNVSLTPVDNIGLEIGDSLVFLAEVLGNEAHLIGYIVITDPLRDDAIHTINALKKMGKEVHICTGADQKTAERYAQKLEIKHICANATANKEYNAKLEYIKMLKNQNRKVAMVGDAGNDAAAVAESDFGFAVLSPDCDHVTKDRASAVIQRNSLLTVATAFAISKQTVRNINQNLVLSVGYNLAAISFSGGLLLALGITLNPAVGVLLMTVQACIVLLNVYRFKKQPIAHLENPDILTTNFPETSSHKKIGQHLKINHQIESPTLEPEADIVSPGIFNQLPVHLEDKRISLRLI